MPEAENLSTRGAVRDDKADVLEICERVYGERDYLPEVWDNWVSNEPSSGEFRIGMLDGRIVGFYHLTYRGNQSWMESLRVDVDRRRMGIGRRLTHDALDRVTAKGSRVIRLVTSQRNLGSRGLFREQAFEEVTYPHYMKFDGVMHPSSDNSLVRNPERDEIVKFLHSSGSLGGPHFLSPLWWRWWEFDEMMLDELLENGSALGLGDGGNLDALLLLNTTSRFGYKNSVQITFLGGTIQTMYTLTKHIPRYLDKTSGDEGITGYFSIPARGSEAEMALSQASFEDGTNLVVVQKILT